LKKFLYIVFVLISLAQVSEAAHLKGGYIEYENLGPVAGRPGVSQFSITVYQYLDCNSNGPQIDADINLAFFDAVTNEQKLLLIIPLSNTKIISKKSFVCIDNPPVVCYRIDSYSTTTELNDNPNGYILAVERCCRIPGINNVLNSSNTGVTYTVKLNSAIGGNGFIRNSSPIFAQEDTALVCASNGFTFPFKSTDPDGDSLVYRFTAGLNTPTREAKPNPPFPPPFPDLQYASGFNDGQPLGASVVINPATGIISGIAPLKSGDYVVAVMVDEYRNRIKIGESRKEIHIAVGNCNIPRAILPASITNCENYLVQFENLSSASGINSYYWDFGVLNIQSDTSNAPQPSYTYPDTGIFKAKLVVNAGGFCPDSMMTDVRIFPGFTVDFSQTGVCNKLPIQFTDLSKTKYGTINQWNWDFGVPGTDTDVSKEQNPVYTYESVSMYYATLTAISSKGCIDSITKPVEVSDKPGIDMTFRDTLICSKDSLMLQAKGVGNFVWTPSYNIINSNTATPVVYPKNTTTYFAELNYRGCIARDSVRVNIVNFISANAGSDTTICLGDPITLNVITQGSKYKWSPSAGLSNDALKNPVAIISGPTITYHVATSLGNCTAEDFITVSTSPYPQVNAGNDTVICFGEKAFLNGSSNAFSVNWQPQGSVQFPLIPVTTATPLMSTNYILSAKFNSGCPKPKRDTVYVKVIPKISVNAGSDTSLVTGQPLQLNGSSDGITYTWSPVTGLSNPDILNPLLQINQDISSSLPEYLRYTLTASFAEGCSASDEIVLRLFKAGPRIYVPSGFTPNSDGKNDILRPILAGMKQLDYFKVYDRYGHIVYDTKTAGAGWNGKINGQPASSGAYVYSCGATDYTGKPVTAKGSFVLIR
jgi:gliding motility-associated-like protein